MEREAESMVEKGRMGGKERTGYCGKTGGFELEYLYSFPPFEKGGNFNLLIHSVNAIEPISMDSLMKYLPPYLSTYRLST